MVDAHNAWRVIKLCKRKTKTNLRSGNDPKSALSRLPSAELHIVGRYKRQSSLTLTYTRTHHIVSTVSWSQGGGWNGLEFPTWTKELV